MSNSELPLHLRGVAESTRRVYSRAVSSFISWANLHHPTFDLSSSSSNVIDTFLADFFQFAFSFKPRNHNMDVF